MAAPVPRAWPVGSISQKDDGTIFVSWADSDLTDEALEDFVTSRLDALFKCLPSKGKGPLAECCVDISGNRLRRPEPITMLLRRLREAPLHITCLRLHKNQFSDIVAAALAEHIQQAAAAKRPLMQLHLSGNALTSAGVRTLIKVAYSCGGYPRPHDAPRLVSLGPAEAWRSSLWLRVEHQRPPVLDAEDLLRECEAEGCPVTIVPKYERVPRHAVVHLHCGFLTPFSTDGKGDAKGKGKGYGKGQFERRDALESAGEKGKGYRKGKSEWHESEGKGKDKGSGKAMERKGGWKGKEKGPGKALMGEEQKEAGSATTEQGSNVKGSGKAHEAKGEGKGKGGKSASQSALYKTEICRFFQRGACEKGDECPYAHGSEELRTTDGSTRTAGAVQQRQEPGWQGKGGDKAADDLEWLKENREREGKGSQEFEAAWKTWCTDKNLSGMVKSQRLASIAAFRQNWEGRNAPAASAQPQEKPSHARGDGQAAGSSATSSMAPDPSKMSTLTPTFTKGAASKPSQAAASESNEEAMLRFLGDRLLRRPAGAKEDTSTAPHCGPSWEDGPPLPNL